jgi:hypothetical protein
MTAFFENRLGISRREMRAREAHQGMHQSTVLGSHWQEDLFEWVRVIIDQRQHSAEIVYEVIQEPAIYFRFDAINKKW